MKKMFVSLLCGALLLTGAAFADGAYTVIVDGAELDLSPMAPYEQDGHVMLPLRKVAEALDFTVTWEQETKSAAMDDGVVKTRVTIGTDSYYLASSQEVGMSAPQTFGAAPALVEDSTYVPAELFTLLCGESSIQDGKVELRTNEKTQLPNPMKAYDTMEEAVAALGFAPKLPAIPEGYTRVGLWVIDGTMLDVRYEKDGQQFMFRAAVDKEDVSGDYSQWENTVLQPEGEITYTLKGNGDTVSIVLWTDAGVGYGLTFTPAVSVETATALSKGVA